MPISKDRILFEDHDLLAVNKLAGELTVKGAGTLQKLPLLDFLKKTHPGIHPLNRLDFETSGVVLFARNRNVLQTIVDSDFRGWKKTYRTIVAGKVRRSHGQITKPLPSRHPSQQRIPAVTSFTVLERFHRWTFVEVTIETGRHHQIRRHFAAIGHPLILDEFYGIVKENRIFTKAFSFRRFFLHAQKVTFPHPVTGKAVTIEAPMPRSFEEVLEKLRKV